MPAPQTATAFVLQSYLPGSYQFGPSRTPNNYTTATLTTTGQTVIPAGASVDVTAWLSYDNQASWVGPVWSTRLMDGQVGSGVSGDTDLTGADHYRVNLEVVGDALTIGATITLT